MKKILLIFTILIFGNKLISQEHKNIPTTFPTDYGIFTFPIGSKVTFELKETKEGKYEYRVLNIEPYKEYYSLSKSKKLFSENPKDNTVEIFFMGAYYNDGKEDKDWKTLLSLRNNLKTPLNYKADIKYYFKDEFENTSISGAFPKTSTNEIWQHKIDFITLYNFEQLKN
ncbi:hypothetical protein [Chryseobacterium luteum]|uniref:Uncharacterized protein n=1 Tax=Chryseobacterium luteum TaxID=421531 RepID=A0A085ZWN0_9FLAO|nr:hypothetical protein [Chryseobacterium luteum]KFF08844.1 hypothetical protein IX38_05310 [Chryseobacterium luteum]